MNIEQQFICLAARTQLSPQDEQRLLRLANDSLDWEVVWAQGHLHEVLPLLATTVRRLAPRLAIPQPWLVRAQRRMYATLIRNTTLADTLVEILQAFQRAGVEAIPVKGLVLAEMDYGGLGLRSLGDLDVLVRPRDLGPARSALAALGFAQGDEPGFENAHHPFHDPPYYRASNGGQVCLELHHGLWASRFFRLGADALWARSRIARIHGAEVRILSPEDTLLHLAIHRSRSALRLRFVCDIAELLRRQAHTLDWEYVIEQARAAGARTSLFFALSLAQELSGAPLPPEILSRLRVGQLKRRILEHTCGVSALFRPPAAGDLSQQPSLLLRLFEQDGLGHIAWNIGVHVARKGQKYLYNYQIVKRMSS